MSRITVGLVVLTCALSVDLAPAEAQTLNKLRERLGLPKIAVTQTGDGIVEWIFNRKGNRWQKAYVAETPMQSMKRSGWSAYVAPWAARPNTASYDGYYIGGGSPFHSLRSPLHEPRTGPLRNSWRAAISQVKGTWGWDYTPGWSRVRLRWWDNRYQAGEGQYQTDRRANPFRDFLHPKTDWRPDD
jgi:hypothetical protein